MLLCGQLRVVLVTHCEVGGGGGKGGWRRRYLLPVSEQTDGTVRQEKPEENTYIDIYGLMYKASCILSPKRFELYNFFRGVYWSWSKCISEPSEQGTESGHQGACL